MDAQMYHCDSVRSSFKASADEEEPFPFLRGSFYRWVQQWSSICSELCNAPQVLAVGDLHVNSFGTWRDLASVVGPETSDFLADVEISARRCLSTGELAYFTLYYESLQVVVSTLPRGSADKALDEYIQTFPEKQRAAVASIDNRMREKLGRRFIEVGIYPLSRYMEPRDVHGRKVKTKPSNVISIQASAAPNERFLTAQAAAVYLGGLNTRTLVRWAREGYLPAIPIGEGKRRVWRFLQTDLEQWMLARRQGGQNAA
ncbi:helix-turn-helix domain-containing protein [Tunturiibacter gelidiferens]|uniref:helix-turn-helix domain-containing protein n=1 Tax=Tunturiibacter gelidiferens TaxID=3069689 RepID=UPI003D9ACBCC